MGDPTYTRCYGFGGIDGKTPLRCPNPPRNPRAPWCAECDERRMAHLTKRFAELAASSKEQ